MLAIEDNKNLCELFLSCLCCFYCRCCYLEKGEYDCCSMTRKVCNGKEKCDRQCMQHTLCDDESSALCRTIYYILHCCKCSWLPSCERCHQVKPLEKGICDACWIAMLDEFNDALEEIKRGRSSFDTQPKGFDSQQTLFHIGIYDRNDAKKWLIKNHPDKTHHAVDSSTFNLVLNYYKNSK